MAKGLSRFGTGMVLMLAAGAAMAPSAALAHAGSEAEQRACTPDVFRLCLSAIPDEGAIVACLKSKRSLLSPACAEVFSDPPPLAPTRGRRGE